VISYRVGFLLVVYL